MDSDFNIYIGARVKKRRKELGISISQFAELLKLSTQQIQKYESGKSKVTAEKLALISHIMNKPIDYFYEDIDFNSIMIGEESKPTILNDTRQSKMRVYLLEDNSDDIMIFKEVVDSLDYVELVASEQHVSEVLPFLYNHHKAPNHVLPDIIFLDINLPDGSSFDLLKRIKEDRTLKHIPVIILSGAVIWDDMMRCYQLGASSYILKSDYMSMVDDRLNHVLEYWGKYTVLAHM